MDRKEVRRSPHTAPGDILTLIEEARNAGELDEAVWRAFLGAHFGRTSMEAGGPDSAFELLCGFTDSPVWTWARVSNDPEAFRAWLKTNALQVERLTFGKPPQETQEIY